MARLFLLLLTSILMASCASLSPNENAQWRDFPPSLGINWQSIEGGWRSSSSEDAFLWSRPITKDELELNFSWQGDSLYVVLAGDSNKSVWHRNTSIIHLTPSFAAVRQDSIFNDGKYVAYQAFSADSLPQQKVHLVIRQAMLQITVNGEVLAVMGLPHAVTEGSTIGFARNGLKSNVTLFQPMLGYWPNK